MNKKITYTLILLSWINLISIKAQIKELTKDGAWCWFSDPRSVYTHQDESKIITGWVKKDGSIEVAELNLKTNEIKTQIIAPNLEIDDHAHPSFVELPDGSPLVTYTKHFDQHFRYHIGSKTEENKLFQPLQKADLFDEEELKKFPLKRLTYANPYRLQDEDNRIYCMGRWTGFKPNITWSDNNGKTFAKSKVFITNYPFDSENRPYVKYHSDGKSKIHIVFTDGHPRNEPNNSVYYACYQNNAFWRIDGTKICDLKDAPIEPKQASLIYKANKEQGKSWVYDVASDKKGNPVILYTRYPNDTTHLYHYAIYDGKKWIDHQICNSGRWFPQTPQGETEREPNYSGGLTVHPSKTNVIYLSRQINGIFEIEKRITKDQGKTWKVIPITKNSKYDNVRPYFPRNHKKGDKDVVFWMKNKKYIHYTDYDTSVMYMVEK